MGAGGRAGAAPTVTVRSHARMAPVQIFEQAPDLAFQRPAIKQPSTGGDTPRERVQP